MHVGVVEKTACSQNTTLFHCLSFGRSRGLIECAFFYMTAHNIDNVRYCITQLPETQLLEARFYDGSYLESTPCPSLNCTPPPLFPPPHLTATGTHLPTYPPSPLPPTQLPSYAPTQPCCLQHWNYVAAGCMAITLGVSQNPPSPSAIHPTPPSPTAPPHHHMHPPSIPPTQPCHPPHPSHPPPAPPGLELCSSWLHGHYTGGVSEQVAASIRPAGVVG